MKKIIGVVVIVGFVLTGCATKEPTFGDRVLAEGNSRIAIAELWEGGKGDSVKGEKLVRSGRKLVEKGREDLRKGEQSIASGNALVQTSRQGYQATSQMARGAHSADTASDRVAKLKSFAKDWEEGEEMIEEGNDLITRGNSRITEGDKDMREGQRLIEQGRAKMQEAERQYQPAPPAGA